jgi:methylenetetrahydrofolate dehydrogenase (NADP+)/methenyltetrahydrofolate cyclohydrolase
MTTTAEPTDYAAGMAARIIDGRSLAATVKQSIAEQVRELHDAGRTVRLDAVLVGGDGAAGIYARNQGKACSELGVEYVLHDLSESATEQDIEVYLQGLNDDPLVHAIMVHLPLPEGIDTERIEALIDVTKDVEGVNPANIGNVVYGHRSLLPCTALAVIEMIESTGVTLRGAHCVCVGASNIVGKPVVVLLMREEATVVSTNKFTDGLAEITREADVLITAVGRPGLITADMVKPGAVVIDVGICRIADENGRMKTCGDVAFDEVSRVAGHLSPVPGGVGPVTVAMLLRNTVEAARTRMGSDPM